MLRNRWLGLVMAWVLVMAAVGCATKTSGAAGSPEEVVTAFYDWLGSVEGSVLGSKAYRESVYLDRAMVDKVDALVTSFETQGGGAYDPFICAQDGPQEIKVTDVEVSGDQSAGDGAGLESDSRGSAAVERDVAHHGYHLHLPLSIGPRGLLHPLDAHRKRCRMGPYWAVAWDRPSPLEETR